MTALQTRTTRSLAVFVLLLGLAVAAGAPSSPIADAGEADADVLVLNDGGQFLFWSFRPAQAAEVFGTVKIAWLFDGVSVSWTSFVPALGVVNFALVAGAVLWVVSDGSQTINVRCATPGAADCLRAVYRGAPGDYAQVADIPADRLVPRGADGRYTVARGQQYHGRDGRPLADRLHPLLPAMAARGPALRHERGAADPARGDDLHLHSHRPTRPGPPSSPST